MSASRPTPDEDLADEDLADLELSPETMTAMGRRVLDRAVAHLAGIDAAPACGDVDAADLCRSLREPSAPERGVELEQLLAPLFDDWIGRSFTTPGPGYLAFIPGGGLFPAALADLVSNMTNRYTGVWQAAPVLVQLEANVLDWFADWMGFPSSTRGLLTTGTSLASLSAVVCAREKHLGTRLREGVLYTSSQAHLCVLKSARMAGILPDRVRLVPVDEAFRMRVDALDELIAADRAAGLVPFLVVSNAGTTNTGAVDPMTGIGALCRREGLWHHVDGAYGAFFHMVPGLRPLLAGLAEADSLALDPHKGMFLPYGTGALLVRRGEDLRLAHAATAGYLPPPPSADDFYDPSQYGPELSRDYRGLRVWMAVKLFGAVRFRAALSEKRTLAVAAAARVAGIPGVVMDAPPQLSLFAFHLSWPGATRDDENEATKQLMLRTTARGRVMLTGCASDGRYLGRVCVLSFRTRQQSMDHCVDDLAASAAEILGEYAVRA